MFLMGASFGFSLTVLWALVPILFMGPLSLRRGVGAWPVSATLVFLVHAFLEMALFRGAFRM